MRCPSCGSQVPNGHSFCTNCGAALPRPGGQNAQPYQADPGPARGYDGGYGYDGYGGYPPVNPDPPRSHAFLYVLIGFLSVLLIAIAVLIITSMNKKEEPEPEVQTVVVTATPTPAPVEQTAAPTPTPTPTPAPTPAYSPEDEAAAKAVIGGYVNAYVADLNDETDAGLAVDGIFGAKTEAAVIHFQALHDLAEDGIVGPKTWAALGVSSGDFADDDAPEEPSQPDQPGVWIALEDWQAVKAAFAAVGAVLRKYE